MIKFVLGCVAVGLIGCELEAPPSTAQAALDPAAAATAGAPVLVLKSRPVGATALPKDRPAMNRAPAGAGNRRFDPNFAGARRNRALPSDAQGSRPGPDREDLDPCGACGDDVGCRLLCFAQQEEEFVPQHDPDVECLECGRETGFLGQPELTAELLGDGDVRLSWEAIPGAVHYSLHSFFWVESRVDRDLANSGQSEVSTDLTELRFHLDEDYTYAFYVVAWSGDRKTHSAPSDMVRVDP